MDLSELLNIAIKNKASDLHICPGQVPILRINGHLQPLKDLAILNPEEVKNFIYSFLPEDKRKALETNRELDFAIDFFNVSRFRVNAYYQTSGIAAAFRVIPEGVPTLDQINIPSIFKDLLKLHHGLILVTGPTGSGKSTTLASMVNYINTTEKYHIITIEDPIEFMHESKQSLITQRQISRDTLSFAAALRSALREDPDVILVGELRDLETIRLALTAAETGHLVMATLHTSSAPRAVSRILDVFPAGEKNLIKTMLAESLQAVISQILVESIRGGRVAAFEIMLGTSAIRNLIREDKIAQMYSIMQTGRDLGMMTLDQYLHQLEEKQIISAESAFEENFRF